MFEMDGRNDENSELKMNKNHAETCNAEKNLRPNEVTQFLHLN